MRHLTNILFLTVGVLALAYGQTFSSSNTEDAKRVSKGGSSDTGYQMNQDCSCPSTIEGTAQVQSEDQQTLYLLASNRCLKSILYSAPDYYYSCYASDSRWRPAFRFDTSSLSGKTVLSATLFVYPIYKYQDGGACGSDWTIRVRRNTSASGTTWNAEQFFTGSYVNLASFSWSSVSENTWKSAALTNPNTNLNKSGLTYLYLAWDCDLYMQTPSPNVGDSAEFTQTAQLNIRGNSHANRPYMVVTTAGGVRLIIVSEP